MQSRPAKLLAPATDATAGIYTIAARDPAGRLSNRVPFTVDTLPETLEQERNVDVARAQKVTLPIIVNGRIDREDDWDVFQFEGRRGETVVAEVLARRVYSPLRIADQRGNQIAINDDCEYLASGLSTEPW